MLYIRKCMNKELEGYDYVLREDENSPGKCLVFMTAKVNLIPCGQSRVC